jgi:hypothetical protein
MKALSTARRKLAALRRRMTILNLSDGTGAVFPVLGDDRYGHSTAQRYLACQDLREKTRPRFGPLLATAERLAREHGMAMLSNLRVDPAIESKALRVPWFVELAVALPGSVEGYRQSLSQDLRRETRLMDALFTVEFTKDERWLPPFREHYNLPTVRAAHGREAYEEKAEVMLKSLRSGMLLRIFHEGRWVAGQLCSFHGDAIHMNQIGLLNGDQAQLPRLTMSAAYWHTMRYAIEHGFKTVVVGGVGPDPRNGLYSFKDKWKAHIQHDRTHRAPQYFFIDPDHARCRRFFAANGLLFWEGERLSLLTGMAGPEELATLERQRYSVRSIDRIYTIDPAYPAGARQEAGAGVPAVLRSRLHRIR